MVIAAGARSTCESRRSRPAYTSLETVGRDRSGSLPTRDRDHTSLDVSRHLRYRIRTLRVWEYTTFMTNLVVSNEDVSIRMFRSRLLESFSRVHPAVPHVIYVPVIALSLFLGWQRGIDGLLGVAMFVAGLLAWTLTEYVIHRFVFHVPQEIEDRTLAAVRDIGPDEAVMPALGWREKIYFVMHGVHHLYPNDSRRLVMPPGVSVPLAVVFFFAFKLALGGTMGPVFFAGFVAGYLVYDTTHFVVHHHRCRGRWAAYVKKLHMRHHYVDPDRGFGVSSPLWDVIMGTRQKLRPRNR